jgi:hypothetical protein
VPYPLAVLRAWSFAGALLLLGSACTGGGAEGPSRGPSTPDPTEAPPRGNVTAAEALEELCLYPEPLDEAGPSGSAASPALVDEVSSQVERLRGLTFRQPVRVEVVSSAGLVRGLRDLYAATVPEDLYRRRSLAWQTIGVIQRGTDINEVFRTFGPVDVIGYYLPGQGLLRMIGEQGESAFERFVLSHELTHALDDQHFDLKRVDELTRACRDDAQLAATALVEGNATVLMYAWAASFLQGPLFGAETILPKGAIRREGHPPLFMGLLGGFPYLDGASFMRRIWRRGGQRAVDRVFEDPPVSTEQILHPNRYPDDTPQEVDVPDLGPALGVGWADLDVQEVGEEWLRALMETSEIRQTVELATEGWDGGLYRAWSNGEEVAVVMTTVWDDHQEAIEFAVRMDDWVDPRRHADVLPVEEDEVTVLFASDGPTLRLLESAYGEPVD